MAGSPLIFSAILPLILPTRELRSGTGADGPLWNGIGPLARGNCFYSRVRFNVGEIFTPAMAEV